jgi:putative acetyltransferase
MITIRLEQPNDILSVHAVNASAFGQPTEADLVDTLRTACPEAISLVALSDDRLVGHILFTPVTINDGEQEVKGMGLAPLSVLPDHQRRGIGSRLVNAGLKILRQRNCPFVIVLGHPKYYPQFGFVPASQHGISCQWPDVPDETFMVLILDETFGAKISGTARYREEFDQAE